MSSAQERQAGTSGSTMGYDQDQAQTQAQGQQVPGQGQVGTQSQGRDYPAAGRDYQPGDRDYQGGRHQLPETRHRGSAITGTALAGTLMLLSGLWMVTVAVIALSHGHVFSSAPAYTFRYNIRGWGWLELALGVVIFAAGMCVFLGQAWARYLGAFLAVLSAIANFVFIPYQPLWSIVMIALDAFIIWALLTPRREYNEI
jgi:hypothetical protein